MKKTILLFAVVLLSLQIGFCQRDTLKILPPYSLTEIKSKEILTKVDKKAEYPNGITAFKTYIQERLERPNELKDSQINGYEIQFVVEIDGTLSNIESTENPKPFGYENAIKIIKQNKIRWTPAQNNGKPVRFKTRVFAYFNDYELYEVSAPPKSYEDKIVDDPQHIYYFAQNDAQYPGGFEAFQKYATENTKYPQKAKDEKIQGRVSVQFVIEKDGTLSNIKSVGKVLGYGLEEEALRLVKENPTKWIPAQQNGKVVRLRKTRPIRFKLP
jgi:periplasmic protein TonB